ncbi:hypothetical protein [uncultured Campylobacter sp.]|uniref:hypothetical protein n=1 Tax=uncultured Campylobacter sp. TaxID=218934 RepID=UPI00262552D6|nr:hypothetical protein [uncultured Campylobacter sp.]
MRNHFRNFKISSAQAESDAGAKFNIKFHAEFFARRSRGRGAEFDCPCSMLCAATKGENKASGREFDPRLHLARNFARGEVASAEKISSRNFARSS